MTEINIYGTLNNATPDGVIAKAEQIKDSTQGKKQSEINADYKKRIETLETGGGTGSGTTDYNDLTNKPQINGHELSGNKSASDLGLQAAGDYALKSEIPDTGKFATKEELNNITPTIGENGNWFINGEDTGKPAKGSDGADGVSLGEIALVQETGTESGSENKVMSQKAVSEKLTELYNYYLDKLKEQEILLYSDLIWSVGLYDTKGILDVNQKGYVNTFIPIAKRDLRLYNYNNDAIVNFIDKNGAFISNYNSWINLKDKTILYDEIPENAHSLCISVKKEFYTDLKIDNREQKYIYLDSVEENVGNNEQMIKTISEDLGYLNIDVFGSGEEIKFNDVQEVEENISSSYHVLQSVGNEKKTVLTGFSFKIGNSSDDIFEIGLCTINTSYPNESSEINVYWSEEITVKSSEKTDYNKTFSSKEIINVKENSYLYVHGLNAGNTATIPLVTNEDKSIYLFTSIISNTGYKEIQGKSLNVSLNLGLTGLRNLLVKKEHKKTLFVDKNDENCYNTIQEAINDAKDGDIIYISPGLYEETVDTGTKCLSLLGQNPYNTIIMSRTGEYSKPPLICCSGFIDGIQFYGKKDDEIDYSEVKGPMYACHLDQRWNEDKKKRKVKFRDCVFINEHAGAIGAGVVEDSDVTIESCHLYAEKAAFQCHTQKGDTGNSNIRIINSILDSKSESEHGILLSNGTQDDEFTSNTITLYCNNNYIKSFYSAIKSFYIKGKTNYGNSVAELNSL